VRWLSERGVPPAGVALAGDSAGGALSAATLLGLRDAGEPLPAAAALLCPWVDPLADGGSMRSNERFDFGTRALLRDWLEAYASVELAAADPRLTPLRADLTGLPPLLVQVGEAEMFLDQARAFAERARAAGVTVQLETYPDMFHDWQVQATMVPEGAAAVASIVRFLVARLA
jgi:acetyl esterase/lipase